MNCSRSIIFADINSLYCVNMKTFLRGIVIHAPSNIHNSAGNQGGLVRIGGPRGHRRRKRRDPQIGVELDHDPKKKIETGKETNVQIDQTTPDLKIPDPITPDLKIPDLTTPDLKIPDPTTPG